jgi:hypothetical protein
MKYELVLYTYISPTPDQQRRASRFSHGAQLEDLKSCGGVLSINEGAWLFDLDRARDRYDQVLSEAEQWGVQLLTIELPDEFVYSLVPKSPLESRANLEERIQYFFSSKTSNLPSEY